MKFHRLKTKTVSILYSLFSALLKQGKLTYFHINETPSINYIKGFSHLYCEITKWFHNFLYQLLFLMLVLDKFAEVVDLRD